MVRKLQPEFLVETVIELHKKFRTFSKGWHTHLKEAQLTWLKLKLNNHRDKSIKQKYWVVNKVWTFSKKSLSLYFISGQDKFLSSDMWTFNFTLLKWNTHWISCDSYTNLLPVFILCIVSQVLRTVPQSNMIFLEYVVISWILLPPPLHYSNI